MIFFQKKKKEKLNIKIMDLPSDEVHRMVVLFEQPYSIRYTYIYVIHIMLATTTTKNTYVILATKSIL